MWLSQTRALNCSQYRSSSSAIQEVEFVGEFEWNSRNEELIDTIVDYMQNNKPLTCRITNIEDDLSISFAQEMRTSKKHKNLNKDRAYWNSWMNTDSPTTQGNAQLATLSDEDKKSNILWNGVQTTFDGLQDVTGTTIVAGVVDRDNKKVTRGHWHALPVINIHVFGSAAKEYRFLSWEGMIESQRSMDAVADFHPQYQTKIGKFEKANCVIFPARMLHSVYTVPSKLARDKNASEFENPNKQLYIGIGTYLVINNISLIEDTINKLEESKMYDSWMKQIGTSAEARLESANTIIDNLREYIPEKNYKPIGYATQEEANTLMKELKKGKSRKREHEERGESSKSIAHVKMERISGSITNIHDKSEAASSSGKSRYETTDFICSNSMKCGKNCILGTLQSHQYWTAMIAANPDIDGVFDVYCETCDTHVHPCCSDELKSMTLKEIQRYDYYCAKCKKHR